MTSLTDVYDGGVGVVADARQRLFGAALFLAGAAMVVVAIPLATTGLGSGIGLSVFDARQLAGILAGLGVPAVFLGILTVLPAGHATRAAAAIGAGLSALGVTLFAYAYPYEWVSSNPAMAVTTALLYSVGTLVTFWCLFVGVATFKTRNDPGGTARLRLTDEGTVEIVSGDASLPGMGGVGLFGADPDGDVRTQTNREGGDEATAGDRSTERTDRSTERTDRSTERTDRSDQSSTDPSDDSQVPTPAGDGAGGVQSAGGRAAADDPAAADVDVEQAVQERGSPDRYCGNCSHFEYVRADGDIAPYCQLSDEVMEDMDACDRWDGAA